MSYWGVIVIIKIVTIIPIIGTLISRLLYCSSFIIINRVFMFHYFLSFVIGGLIILHIVILHTLSSSNPYINNYSTLLIPFILLLYKDLFCFNYLIMIISYLFFWEPDILGNKLNLSKCINYSIKHNTWMIFLFILFHY